MAPQPSIPAPVPAVSHRSRVRSIPVSDRFPLRRPSSPSASLRTPGARARVLRSDRSRPELRVGGDAHRCELKAKLDAMVRSALEVVDQEPVSRLDEYHTSTVCHGIRQPSITPVIGVREIQGRRRDPATQPSARSIPPGEWSGGNRLRLAVDDDCAVRRSAAKKSLARPHRLCSSTSRDRRDSAHQMPNTRR